jgi:CheY-like chemotaxis protein
MAKILLIEDDATMITLLRTLLEIEGFSVAQFDARADVLEQIRSQKPDAVLLDVNFKGMDASGFEVLRALRADPALAGTRVLMASGINYEQEAREAGADAFLLKPFMPDALIERIRGLL